MKNSAVLRKVLRAIFVAGLVWSIFTMGSVPPAYAEENSGANAQAGGSLEAVVSLSVDSEIFGESEAVILHASITNPNAEAIQVLRWYILADGMEEPLLRVTRDGEPVTYLGPVFKRRAPTEQDYLVLQPGETVSGSLDLSSYYDLSASGNYSITYDVSSAELYARQDTDLLKRNGRMASNEVKLFIEGRSRPSLNAIAPEIVNGPTTFTGCSATRQNQLLTARNDASNYAANSASYLNAGKQGNRYITWFGTYLLNRYNTAKSHFANINNAMTNATVHFDCTCTDPNVYAYVFPNQPYSVYLCGAFWGAPATGTDSKAGTLVHEMSHFTVLGGTQDWVYGQAASKSLAINDPAKAVTNADNHEYFAENTPDLEPPLDSFEPDNDSTQAKSIALGATQNHSISPATDIDWVKFQLTTPSAVILETSGAANGDTRMWLYNSSLQQIRFSDNEGAGNYSYINTCDLVNLAAGTYYVKVDESGNNNEITSYNISVSAGNNCVGIALANTLTNTVPIYPGASTRHSLAGANNGPVQVFNIDGSPIIAAERVIYKVNGIHTSFTEMMGLPDSLVGTEYWLPVYDNVNLDTQLRIANVSNSAATVHVYIGGVEMQGSPFSLGVGVSTRKSYPVYSGPVQIVSNVPIVVAERVIYRVNNVNTSFSEIMALPGSQLNTTYWLPWYNNVDLNTELRIGNTANSTASVRIYIGGTEMPGGPFAISADASILVSFSGINNGPVRIVSNVPVVASERVIYKVNNVNTSFSELMALPNSHLNTVYWLPWYNNVDLDTQLRFANVSGSSATIHVYIGGAEVTGSPFTLAAGASTRKSFAGVNNGPVQIVSNVNIVVAERVIYRVNSVNTSFTEMMALPNSQLNTSYRFPWYNNVDLDTQLRFGMP